MQEEDSNRILCRNKSKIKII